MGEESGCGGCGVVKRRGDVTLKMEEQQLMVEGRGAGFKSSLEIYTRTCAVIYFACRCVIMVSTGASKSILSVFKLSIIKFL